MSLNERQREETARELREAMERAGVTPTQVEKDLAMGPAELDAVLRLTGRVEPARVWLLRDYLAKGIEAKGAEPVQWSALSEANRTKAEGWFGLDEAPTPRPED